MLIDNEKNILHQLMDEATETGYRVKAKMILLKDDGYTVPGIRRLTIPMMLIP